MKERTRKTDAYANRESDKAVRPEKSSNKGEPSPAEMMEERALAKGNAGEEAVVQSLNGETASYGLNGVRQRATKDKQAVFTNLKHHITGELLRESFYDLNRKAAPGVDGVRWEDYEEDLEEKLKGLHERVQKGSYRAKPVLRKYIEKESGTLRPLGITAVEDKIVQQAVVKILQSIYEAEMFGFSYGFRAGKGAHDALDALAASIYSRRINWVLDADIQSFFDQIPHDLLMEKIGKRVNDPWILRLIQKWLKTGYSEDGVIHRQMVGTPQGSVISPILANIYLHYVLDQWIDRGRHREGCGDVIIVRYADDFVIGFQSKTVADKCLQNLHRHFQRFGLTLHPEKTRLIEFGRFAGVNRKRRGEGKPETFDFLGFTHICSVTKKGTFILKRITIRKRLRNKVKEVRAKLRKAMHRSVNEMGEWLARVLNGYNRYFGVPGNSSSIRAFRDLIINGWLKVLRRRSQKGRSMSWEKFSAIIDSYIPRLYICHPYPEARFDANNRGRSRMR